MDAQCVKRVINLGGPLAWIRRSYPGVTERLQDLLIDAYLATLVDVHADGCVHAVMVVGVTGRSDPDRIRVYTRVVGWSVPVSQGPHGALARYTPGLLPLGAPPLLIAHVPVAMPTEWDAVRAAARQRLGTYGRLPFYAPQGLEILVRRHTTPQQVATRARIVLAAADGQRLVRIADPAAPAVLSPARHLRLRGPIALVGDMHHNLSHSPRDRATHQGPGIIRHPASLIDGPRASRTTVWWPRGRPVRLVPTMPQP